ncbi:protein FAR1-RELATED SEQUENCE 5-like [Macadamia integrifolia]|uniref:protein FAR1-RELATED SEQUENCE 5-like n=1 Tax=Macadamia integrifolia TaxID=60698 RepID=UPI001C4F7B52|nr:protein FAR1-RELATED SEQUENCE 5-like [Macadamia integrifolia]XP_042507428.1 protein FAR1-RELATED SEQUENCE 5-like [Macadamia integrifolia]
MGDEGIGLDVENQPINQEGEKAMGDEDIGLDVEQPINHEGEKIVGDEDIGLDVENQPINQEGQKTMGDEDIGLNFEHPINQEGEKTMGDEDIGLDVENQPRIGMKFNSENEAYDFYNSYGARMGFSVRRNYAHRSRKDKTIVTSRMFVCSKQGYRKKDNRCMATKKPRAETRIDCPARMGIAIMDNGQYQCRDFVEEHNHLLHLPVTIHMMRSQQKLLDVHASEIDLADDFGIKPNATFEYIGRHAGRRQNHGHAQENDKNYLRTKRQRALSYGESGSLLLYFIKQTKVNPFFTYSLQLDDEEQITNIFWADPKMIIDYAQFGDVVTFDTTFCISKEYRPFSIFAGFNHHGGVVIFGVALLYDLTTESFKWLFEAFLEAHGQKKPITIFTDQDDAMERAIAEVFPKIWHGLCTWHIMQNGIKHLGNLMKDGTSFLKDFKTCMFHYGGELEFEKAWEKLRNDYEIKNGSWLDRIYGLKEKWAKCYMKKIFTIGMQSTQLSESLNRDLKDYLKSNLDVVQFLEHFERIVNEKRDNELKAEFDAKNKVPRNMFYKSPVMKQAGEVYTPWIFEEFQAEYNWIGACYIKFRNESNALLEYVVAIFEQEGDFKVLCNPSEAMIECSCRKFETFGILCCHALKILDVLDVKFIPKAYILRRWTWAARSMLVEDNKGKQVEENVHLDCTQCYRLLCPKLVNIASQASKSAEGYALVNKVVDELCKQLENIYIDAPHLAVSSEGLSAKKIEELGGTKRKEKDKSSYN